ncbi:spore photoproduct lyase [Clostridium sp. DL1XJH146]
MFVPEKIIFEEKALKYNIGNNIYSYFEKKDIDIEINKQGRVSGLSKKELSERYHKGKKILVVGTRKITEFQTCKPSADYQIPLLSGCPGMCEYCYLHTQFGKRPYIKVYANIDEILKKADEYLDNKNLITFEGAATSDPLPVEPYTGLIKKTIEFVANKENAAFRFVTKFTDVDSLLNIDHKERTTIRFTLNTDYVIGEYEHKTPSLDKRIEASKKISEAKYKLGFIIAPVIIYDNWKEEYLDLLKKIKKSIKTEEIEFEVITHRYTPRAKENIVNIFPKTKLPLGEENRIYKYGQFGYGKFVYNKENMQEVKEFFIKNITEIFGEGKIKYII